MGTLNLGILAHVDAGKTSLTERLLFTAGVIDEVGSVDDGSTQTDTLALERQRGITIKSAVVSFAIGDLTVNLIDTPGHPDFIAEVERTLTVLDGAVLVVSAVEGVQAQTRVLMRALRRLRIPALIFINKIDRRGARPDAVLAAVAATLTPDVVAMGSTGSLGSKEAIFVPNVPGDGPAADRLTETLAEHDDALLAAWLDDERGISIARLRRGLARQSRCGQVHPVYFGSAITGAGVAALTEGIRDLLPRASRDARGPGTGTVFKVERGPAGEKIAYVRMFTGTVRARDRVRSGPDQAAKVTAVSVFGPAGVTASDQVSAGQIGKLWGLAGVRIGDRIGPAPDRAPARQAEGQHGASAGREAEATLDSGGRHDSGRRHDSASVDGRQFAPPTLETVVVPGRPADRGLLHLALTQLAEQDPLIDLRRDEDERELRISLYGEVQKEVVAATLASDYGLTVSFRDTATLCVERLAGTGAAAEPIKGPGNPFLATVGLRAEPGATGTGVSYRVAGDRLGTMPPAFFTAVEDTVRATLRQGPHGWPVPDVTVTLTHTGYYPRQSHAHARFDKSMSSTGADFRGLTPLVLMAALAQAGTVVCEPVHRFRLELPADTLATVLPVLASLRATPDAPEAHGAAWVLTGDIPAARVHELQLQLRGLTRGEGVLEAIFSHYQPVRGTPPEHTYRGPDPRHREEYLLNLTRRTGR